MMVPSAFAYRRSKSPTPASGIACSDEKRSVNRQRQAPDVRGFGWRPASFKPSDLQRQPEIRNTCPQPKGPEHASNQDAPAGLVGLSATAAPPHSQPVAVPSRRQKHQQSSSASLPSHSGRSTSRGISGDRSRDRPTIPPSVAAVLTSTSIPRRTSFPKRNSVLQERKISIDELVEEWKKADQFEPSSLSSSPAMDLLLSPPEELDEDPMLSVDDDDDDSFGSPKRTLSNNSMPSLDDSSSQSGVSLSFPSTPSMAGLAGRGRERIMPSPRSVEVGTNHPLHTPDKSASEDLPLPDMSLPPASLATRAPSASPEPAKPSSNFWQIKPQKFRSNLTASLKGLRSNISRSFANFTAPGATVPVDHLTTSFLGSAPYHPEMRPRPISGTPDSKLRRYMNPHAFQPYDFHLHNHAIHDADLEVVAAANAAAAAARAQGMPDAPAPSPDMVDAIPLEPFLVSGAKGRSGSSGATEAGRARNLGNQTRREPRENPEFLRIAVLELQMRRAGKTEGPPVGFGAGMGRRGWWLAPREANEDGVAATYHKSGKIPGRWVGVLAE